LAQGGSEQALGIYRGGLRSPLLAMSSIAAAVACTLALLTGSEAEARGETPSGNSADICRTLVKQFEDHDDFELAALCRARVNPAECHDARRALGPRPWSEESIDAACKPWPVGRLLDVVNDKPTLNGLPLKVQTCQNVTGKTACSSASAVESDAKLLSLDECESACIESLTCYGISWKEDDCQIWDAVCDIDSQPTGPYLLESGLCFLQQKLDYAMTHKQLGSGVPLDTTVTTKTMTTTGITPEEMWSAAPGGSVATSLLSSGGAASVVVATAAFAGLGFLALASLAGRSRWGLRDVGVHIAVPTNEDDGDLSWQEHGLQEEAFHSDYDEDADREVSRPLIG